MKTLALLLVLAASEESGQLTVEVGPLRSAGGVVHCNLWKTSDGFPSTGTFGPPKFEDAKFRFDGKALTLRVSPK